MIQICRIAGNFGCGKSVWMEILVNQHKGKLPIWMDLVWQIADDLSNLPKFFPAQLPSYMVYYKPLLSS